MSKKEKVKKEQRTYVIMAEDGTKYKVIADIHFIRTHLPSDMIIACNPPQLVFECDGVEVAVFTHWKHWYREGDGWEVTA